MEKFRTAFPGVTITQKLHMLEEHIIPWIRRWQFGLGFYGEQGAESIHAVFNSLQRNYHSIPNPLDRLKSIVKAHHLQVSPYVNERRPTVKKRKMNDYKMN